MERPIMILLIRPAIQSDVRVIAGLCEAKRKLYAEWQPRFHKPAEGAKELHMKFLQETLHHEDSIVLVADDRGTVMGAVYGRLIQAPPVYNPGGKVLLVDDFVLADPNSWLTTGKTLLAAIWERGQAQGAALLNVVCGPHDEPKRALLKEFNLSVASEWWVSR
jgi:hypothetical protein